MGILDLFKNTSSFKSGAVLDVRTEKEKEKDYTFKEIVASASPVQWVEKPESMWRKFPIYNQDGSGSCVAQSIAKALGIMYWLENNTYVHFSATHLYQRRVNKPASGMGAVDAWNIASKGITLEDLVPSQNMSDYQMDSVVIPEYKKKVGEIFKVPNYIELPTKNIDTIASTIQTTKKGVVVWFYFENREWTTEPVVLNPNLDLYGTNTARHSVIAVDWTMYNGKKALIIEDSWGSSYGKAGQRIITEDWFKARNFYAGYPMNFKFDGVVTKPSYQFDTDLEFGMTHPDVVGLQNCLKYEGLFPSNIDSTGFYGAVTKKAVIDFQAKYGIETVGRVGAKTRAKLNELF